MTRSKASTTELVYTLLWIFLIAPLPASKYGRKVPCYKGYHDITWLTVRRGGNVAERCCFFCRRRRRGARESMKQSYCSLTASIVWGFRASTDNQYRSQPTGRGIVVGWSSTLLENTADLSVTCHGNDTHQRGGNSGASVESYTHALRDTSVV